MSISELGSLGEFLGSIAVLVTLIVLTIQMRQNTKAMENSMSAAMVSQWIDNANAFAGNPDLSRAWELAASKGADNVDRAEVMRLVYWIIGNLKAAEFAFLQWQSGNLSEDLWATNERGVAQLVAGNPMLNRTTWDLALKSTFTEDFQVLVESMIAQRADSDQ